MNIYHFFNTKKSKNAIADITSFVLIFLVSTIVSLGVYFYVDSNLEEQISQQELNNIEKQLISIKTAMDTIQNFPRVSETLPLSFDKGNILISSTAIRYVSFIEDNSSSTVCVDLCYDSYLGFQSFYINTTGTPVSSPSTTLNGNSYLLSISYIQSTSGFNVSVR